MKRRRSVQCSVCVDATSQSKLVVCPFCHFSCCRACFTRVLLGGSDDAHCMSCRRRFDREVLLALTSSHFVNSQYKQFRERVLFERERAMVPATMPYVELEKDVRAARNRIEQLTRERYELRLRLRQIGEETVAQQRIAWRTEPVDVDAGSGAAKRAFTQRCTREGCLGWLNSSYRCGACSHFACPKCLAPCGQTRESVVDGHVCREEDVESVRAIRDDSTPCPSCGIRVSKVSGCSQMWCVHCHCTFDYRTGGRVNGTIHNPHWFLYQQQQQQQQQQAAARDPADIPCGAMVSVAELRAVGAMTTTFLESIRMVGHVQHVEIPTLNPRGDIVNRHWRVKYILGEIEEADFKVKLQRQDKTDCKNRESVQVLEMICNTVTDELRQVVVGVKTSDAAEMAIMGLIAYANDALSRIAARYNQVTPRLLTSSVPWRVRHAATATA